MKTLAFLIVRPPLGLLANVNGLYTLKMSERPLRLVGYAHAMANESM